MNNLKSLRLKANMTQEEVAKRLNIARTTYKNYENGDREPNFDTLKDMARLFNTTIDYLLGFEKVSYSKQKQDLLNAINSLTDDECEKLYNYAEGMLVNRKINDKKRINEIQNDKKDV